MREKPV
ncbi:67bf6b2d-fae9-43ec-91da-751f92689b2e [Thermothielavioides terrestris]|nr:67bf6b2d-fae9-43ec-91da-751f92689b2e [Thermothielavioides terrestris]